MNAQNSIPQSFASLWTNGYRNLIPVSPPDGKPYARKDGSLSIPPESMGKAPAALSVRGTWFGFKNWQSHQATEDEITTWSSWAANIGMVMGVHTVSIDVDVLEPSLAEKLEAFVKKKCQNDPKFNNLALRYGNKPKHLWLARVKNGETIPSQSTQIVKSDYHGIIEVQGIGRQAVVAGIHPNGNAYKWPLGLPAWHELPELTAEDIDKLVIELLSLAELDGWQKRTLDAPSANFKEHETSELGALSVDPELTSHLFAKLDNNYDRIGWYYMLLAAAGAGVSDDAVYEFCARGSKSGYKSDITLNEWERAKIASRGVRGLEGSSGAGKIHGLAAQQGLMPVSVRERLSVAIDQRKKQLAEENLIQVMATGDQGVREIFNLSTDDLSAGVEEREAQRQPVNTGKLPEIAQSGPQTSATGPNKADPFDPGGLVSELANFGEMRSERETRMYAFAGALVAVSAVARNKWLVKRGVRATPLNLQVLALGPSGDGKETARDIVKTVVRVEPTGIQVSPNYASEAALHEALTKKSTQVWLSDEYGQFVKAAGSAPGSHGKQLVDKAVEIHTSALTYIPEKSYSDGRRNKPQVDGPYLTALFTSTPDAFLSALDKQSVVSGFLGRQLALYQTEETNLRSEAAIAMAPNRLHTNVLDALKRIERVSLSKPANGSYTPDSGIEARTIRLTDEAENLARKARTAFDDKRKQAAGIHKPLYARAFEQALRVAGVFALGQAAMKSDAALEQPKLDKTTLLCAIALVEWSFDHILEAVAENAAETDGERIRQALEKQIRQNTGKDGWAQYRTVSRMIIGRGRTSAMIKAEIEALVAAEHLEFHEVQITVNGEKKMVRSKPQLIRLR